MAVAMRRLGWVVAVVFLRCAPAPESVPDGATVRFVLDVPADQLPAGLDASEPGPGVPFALSQDGTRLAYRGGSLFLRDLTAARGTRLPETAGADRPFFSPDGEWLGFHEGGRLWKAPLAGGSRVALCEVTLPLSGITWSTDDTIVFGDGTGRLMQVSAEGGEPTALTEPRAHRGEMQHFAPQALPDGRAILFTAATEAGARVAVLDLASGRWKYLHKGRWPRYVAPGFLVFSLDADLLAVRFDARRRETIGSPVTVLPSLHADEDGLPFAAVSESGTIVYVPSDALAPGARLVWVDRDGGLSPAMHTVGLFESPRLSPGGASVLVVETGELWIYTLADGSRRPVEHDGAVTGALWTPDGSAVTYSTDAAAIRVQPLDGKEAQTLVPRDGGLATAWHPSGERLFTVRSTSVGLDVWAVTSTGELEPVLTAAFDQHSVRPSPDGRWLAYVSNASGRDEVYLQSYYPYDPYSGAGRTLGVSREGGNDPVWSPLGHELFYRSGTTLMSVPLQTRPHAVLGRPRKLFDLPFLDAGSGYEVTRDGERFLTVQPVEPDQSQLLHVISHWDTELTRLVPAIH